jgi:heme A synthase
MKTAYRVLAYAIAAMVAIQSAAIGYAVFAEFNWIEEKAGTVDAATLDSGGMPGIAAFIFHQFFAGVVFLTALALLIISFFAKEIPQGVRWAVIVLASVFVQIALGTLSHLLAAIGALHGAMALVVFGLAVTAAMRTRRPAAVVETAPTMRAEPVEAGPSTSSGPTDT